MSGGGENVVRCADCATLHGRFHIIKNGELKEDMKGAGPGEMQRLATTLTKLVA